MESSLGDAVALCREIERVIEPQGAHCALTGSCLYKGHSEKDIDVMIYPHQGISNPYNKEGVLKALQDAAIIDDGSRPYQTTPNYLDKDVVLTTMGGRRVDLFFFL